MAETAVNARWQAEMVLFFVDLDGRPDEGFLLLEEVFRLEYPLADASSPRAPADTRALSAEGGGTGGAPVPQAPASAGAERHRHVADVGVPQVLVDHRSEVGTGCRRCGGKGCDAAVARTVPQPNPSPWPNHCSFPSTFSGRAGTPSISNSLKIPVAVTSMTAQIWLEACAPARHGREADPARWFIQLRFRKAISGTYSSPWGRLDLVGVVAVAEAELDVHAIRSGGRRRGAPSSVGVVVPAGARLVVDVHLDVERIAGVAQAPRVEDDLRVSAVRTGGDPSLVTKVVISFDVGWSVRPCPTRRGRAADSTCGSSFGLDAGEHDRGRAGGCGPCRSGCAGCTSECPPRSWTSST